MANLIIVAALTVIRGVGKADLGERDFKTFTISDVKKALVEKFDDLEVERIQLWWKGYLLDDNVQSIVNACVGANGEKLEDSNVTLTLFLTVTADDNKNEDSEYPSTVAGRLRANSFDVEKLRVELRRQKQRIVNCAIM
uniref:Ubiquitin-like domain-containing protein n=1 Tax=Eucampia antarctica TaxID=49252 RepID=A0A7S2SGW5_9STRA|mmetsp:Transcript_8126/g.7663  ORF Transcript_8126/g.7663 Transcript_8126/m.7663 type:complete len:139 (+) Transcript_8126:251-667(+)|eukprot:CAMPEP_0197825272 /NCGR_PEP_ID=MMETSP1437-20131217/2378_1 /TAXON_ID=49252 ORGANISM="Eucampia antarctica, Strain CCMP1452" /NCGR_SAMPLE_ID=MMETSP1437 /ASSEMBLY_ACC=CAM_ASM_001096 /LENGTH=138 /DNA_ID=CAMNT_0043425201 /DNA_START=241 /DNA_END=657 /DNA_ORIENTATION=-